MCDVEPVECFGLFRCDLLLRDEGTFDVLKLSVPREPKVPPEGLFWLHQRTSENIWTTVRAGPSAGAAPVSLSVALMILM